jgi:hypothetical protein
MSQEPEELEDDELEDFLFGLLMEEADKGDFIDTEEVLKYLKE